MTYQYIIYVPKRFDEFLSWDND